MHDLLPAAAVTVAPSGLLLAVAWALRGQCTPRAWSPRRQAASAILARLEAERAAGLLPDDTWGGVRRPPLWTVTPSRELVPVALVERVREQAGVAA